MFIKKIINILCAIILLSIATQTFAATEGFYLGLMAGKTRFHQGAKDVQTGCCFSPPNLPPCCDTVLTTPNNNSNGARIFGGYQYGNYAAWELGYTYYGTAAYNVSPSCLCGTPTSKFVAIDILGKGILPLGCLDAFGKGGLSVVRMSNSGSLAACTVNCSSSNTFTQVRPTAAAGFSFTFDQNWVLDVSWTRVFGSGNIKTIDFLAAGVSYHWVSRYCGQFLC